MFCLTTGIIKKVLQVTRNKKKKHNKILVIDKNKLNSIETLISQALIGFEITHEEFITFVKEKEIHEKMRENIRNTNKKLGEKTENTRLNSFNSRT